MKLRRRLDRLEAPTHELRAQGTPARDRLAARLELVRQHDPDAYNRAAQAIRRTLERRGAP